MQRLYSILGAHIRNVLVLVPLDSVVWDVGPDAEDPRHRLVFRAVANRLLSLYCWSFAGGQGEATGTRSLVRISIEEVGIPQFDGAARI